MKWSRLIIMMSIYMWIGFTCAISFMEAWLKFRAPGVSLPVGLGIGRLVFSALNKVEWGFVIVLTACFLFGEDRGLLTRMNLVLYIVILLLLALETFWLLPRLDALAAVVISGEPVAPSRLHIYFVAAELLKTLALLFLGAGLFRAFHLADLKTVIPVSSPIKPD
ncbi:hypothetical protein [Compostibacter hankyongensis]